MARPELALQMYTVRDDARSDFAGTLRKVARIGYPAVQLAGYGGLSANALRSLLDGFGLKVAGSHIDLSALEGSLDAEFEYNRAIGNRDLVCPAAPRELRSNADGFRTLAGKLNLIGERCQGAGFRLSYHNHAFEFERFGATTGLEILLSETRPDLVAWEPDVYWIAFAKEDPAGWIRRDPGRCPIVHLKDMTAGDSPTYAEVGEGILDFQPIFETAADAEWYVVEQDTCARPPLESAALSLKHLREWGK
ncbi:MAG: sugar phosphate isomerase/epimerase family protein [Chloroflexota bacterium]